MPSLVAKGGPNGAQPRGPDAVDREGTLFTRQGTSVIGILLLPLLASRDGPVLREDEYIEASVVSVSQGRLSIV